MTPYAKSKVLAEKAAWEFCESLPEDEKIELATVLPGFVVGPSLCGPGFTSEKAILYIMSGKGIPRISMPMVDVRDCAMAHLKAIQVDEAKDKRYILCDQSIWFVDIARIIHEEFQPQGYNFSVCEAKYCLVKFASFFNDEAALMVPLWNVKLEVNNSRSKEILGINYRPPKESFNEMVYSMIETGVIPDKRPTKAGGS